MAMEFGPEFFDKFGVSYKENDIIFCEYEPGNTFYFLMEGKVKITKIASDKEKILDVLEPGEIFGEMAILEEAPRSASIVALNNVKVLEFNKDNFSTLMSAKPELALKLLKIFAKRIYDQKRRLENLTLGDPHAKIADLFLILAENKNIDLKEAKELTFDVNVEFVSNWCGMGLMECRTILEHFAKQGRITLYPHKIVVTNINDFYRFVLSKKKSSLNSD